MFRVWGPSERILLSDIHGVGLESQVVASDSHAWFEYVVCWLLLSRSAFCCSHVALAPLTEGAEGL